SRGKTAAIHRLHGEKDEVILVTREVQRHDVRMRELRDRLGLTLETIHHRVGRDHIRRQNFYRQAALERLVLDEKDYRKSARAKAGLDGVVRAQRRLKARAELVQFGCHSYAHRGARRTYGLRTATATCLRSFYFLKSRAFSRLPASMCSAA